METTSRKSLHPLVATAAIAIIILSVVGIGAITGFIPTSKSTPDPNAAPIAQPEVASPPAGAPAAQQQTAKAVAPAPVQQTAPHPAAPASPPAPAAAQPPAPVAAAQPPAPPVAAAEPPAAQPKPICVDCGTVESVREIKQAGDGSGLGAVAGGVAGAVLGNQVGGGTGRRIATVAGAVGGAVAGHQVEKHVKSNTVYEISVRMDDGNVRSFTEANPPSWRAGDKVRVQDGRLTTQG